MTLLLVIIRKIRPENTVAIVGINGIDHVDREGEIISRRIIKAQIGYDLSKQGATNGL